MTAEQTSQYQLGVADGKILKELGLSRIAMEALIVSSGLCRKIESYPLHYYHKGLNDTIFGKRGG